MRVTAALAAALSVAAIVPGTTAAVSAVDQSNLGGSPSVYLAGGRVAQTFTVGTTGQLRAVDVVGYLDPGPAVDPAPIVISITGVDGMGVPSGPSMTANQVLTSGVPGAIVHDDLFNMPVTAGQQLAIVFYLGTLGSAFEVTYTTNSAYAGGEAFYDDPINGWRKLGPGINALDLVFQTYVEPPAPDPCASPSATPTAAYQFAPAAEVTTPACTPPPTSSAAPASGSRASSAQIVLAVALAAVTLGVLIRRRERLGARD
jgi:hypothetical protein